MNLGRGIEVLFDRPPHHVSYLVVARRRRRPWHPRRLGDLVLVESEVGPATVVPYVDAAVDPVEEPSVGRDVELQPGGPPGREQRLERVAGGRGDGADLEA